MIESVLGIVLSQDRKEVLFIKRKDVPVWVLPGGGVDDGETPEQAVAREIEEESGLQVSVARKACEFHAVSKLGQSLAIFECQPHGGSLTSTDESLDAAFFPLEKLPAPLFYLHRNWLMESLSSTSTIIRPLSEVNYWNFFLYILKHPFQVLTFWLAKQKAKRCSTVRH